MNMNKEKDVVIKFRKDISEFKGVVFCYRVENFIGRGIPDLLVTTLKNNYFIEFKSGNYTINKIQKLFLNCNKNNFLIVYKNQEYFLYSEYEKLIFKTADYKNILDFLRLEILI